MPHEAFGVAARTRINVVGQAVINAVNSIPINLLQGVVVGMGRGQGGKQPREEDEFLSIRPCL